MPPPPIRPKTRLQELLYEHFSQGGEVATLEEGWRLTDPPTPNSGYSVGWLQLDLAGAKGTDEFKAVMGVIARHPQLAGNAKAINAIEKALEKKDADLTASDKSVIKQYGDLINQALASPEGKRTLDQIGFERLEEIEGDIEHLKSIAGPEAKPFLESQEGQLLIADYINQFGGPTVLEDFVQGKEVTLNDGKNKIKLDGPLTFEKWREYVGKTRFGESHPTIIDSRFDNVKDTLGRHRLLPDAPRARPQGQQPATPSGAPGQRSGLEEGKAAARAGSGADLAASPEGRRFLAALKPKAGEEVKEVLLKPVNQWTKGEMGALMDDPDYWRTATPRGRLLQDKARAWHDHFFGTGPAPEDETGRMLPSRPSRPIPTSPAPVRAADGGDLAGSVLGIGKQVLAAAAESGLSEAIRGLQNGLNGLQTGDLNGLAGVMGDSGAVGMDRPALAVDGVFGPKTRWRLRQTVARFGRAPVEKSFASGLARFRPSHRPGSRV